MSYPRLTRAHTLDFSTVDSDFSSEQGMGFSAGHKKVWGKNTCELYSSKKNMDNLVRGEYSVSQLKDMKRAGDRGQVLHAQKYGKVIVTRNKFMALYAYALKVPFVLVRRRRPADYDHPFVELHTWVLPRHVQTPSQSSKN